VERLLVPCSRISDRMRQAAYRLDVLSEHIEAAVDNGLDGREIALEIRRQRLDGSLRTDALDLAHACGEMTCAAVRQIVAIHGRQHDVSELHQLHGTRAVRGFFLIEPSVRIACIHRTEPTRTR